MSRKRKTVVALALIGTLTAAYLAPEADEGVALAERNAPREVPAQSVTGAAPSSSARSHVGIVVARERQREADDIDDELGVFAARTPELAPKVAVMPEAAAPVAPAAPQAPPVPFRVTGRYVEDAQVQIFLQHNDRTLVVRVGDTIADQYKVDSLSGSTLTLRYLPLDIQQTLDVGAID